MPNWNTSLITDMREAFSVTLPGTSVTRNSALTVFNGNITKWDTSQVTHMYLMFSGCTAFNQDISGWNTAQVTQMHGVFNGCSSFNQPLANWTTTAVKTMQGMFAGATAFNQPIGIWNTASVTNMQEMFNNAASFNQDIYNWTGTAATDVNGQSNQFNGATAFRAKYVCTDSVKGPASSCNTIFYTWSTPSPPSPDRKSVV